MKVIELSTVLNECGLAANAFSVNEIGLALMHTTKSLMHCIKCSGNVETLKELITLSDKQVIGQSPNKMSAISMALLYQASFHADNGELRDVAATLLEICSLYNVNVGVLSADDFSNDDSITNAATVLIQSNSKLIIETIKNA